MELHVEKIIKTFSRPINHTESLLKLFHQNRLPQNVAAKDSMMCQKCLTPWTLGKYDLSMKPSNGKRVTRRNHRIERLQSQIKSKQISQTESKTLLKKIKRLQQQNNHIAIYKCFCSKTTKTKVQLRKKQKDKHNKSENVPSVTIMSEETKQQIHDSNPSKIMKIKKKKKKTAGLLIPLSTKTNAVTSSSSRNINLAKISELFRQQKNIDETHKQQSKLNQFFK